VIGARAQILLTVISVLLVGVGLIYLVTEPLLADTLAAQHEERATWMAEVISRDLALTTRNDTDLTRRMTEWSASLERDCIGVITASGQIYGHGSTELGRCLDAKDLATLVGAKEKQGWFGAGATRAFATTAPVTTEALGGLGTLVYVGTASRMTAKIFAVRSLILMFSSLAAVLVTIIGYTALTQLIVRPLSRTMRAIEKVHGGDLDARAAYSGGREMHELQDSFNKLAQNLKEDDQRIHRQITELKLINEQLERAQSSLVRSEKLATVGKLAAGVAHEIGNPIGIVLGYLEVLKGSDIPPEQREEYVAQCIAATERISAIIRDLLDFSRPDSIQIEEGEVSRVIEATIQLLHPQKRFKTVTIKNEVPDGKRWLVGLADARLVQVLLNLMLNAADAMANVAEPCITLSVMERGDRVLIRIHDNGPGMPPGVQKKIFDPFFTTKEPGSGTGLGLSICHTIVTSVDGDLTVDSAPETGTTFTIELPPVDPDVTGEYKV